MKFTPWKRTMTFRRKLINHMINCHGLFFRWLYFRNEATQWYLGIEQILTKCGIPLAEEYVDLVSIKSLLVRQN